MNKVSEKFAIAEAEGDRTYRHWWKTHVEFFRNELNSIEREFSDGKVLSNVNDGTEGKYKWNEDENELVIDFENENESLEIKFINFKKSEKKFSVYSTSISGIVLDIKDSDQVIKSNLLTDKLQKDLPIELIEK